ncbi:hypothetical protein COCNU_13G006420 [Cocos nucifera]|uniref:Serine carboxypeptidase n=1 Tax=Cocos nucifera TaxID=13894 RepID=A0A8K0IT48_COCNU|nr:hypothetical protein COCNU_13G006420 [Cocos nucifera]
MAVGWAAQEEKEGVVRLVWTLTYPSLQLRDLPYSNSAQSKQRKRFWSYRVRGPLKFVTAEYNGSVPTLVYHPYSWTKVANMIFLDSPVGTGFSFSRTPEGYAVGDISWSVHVYKFLRKWFIDHERFLSNSLYIAGISYSGKVVPVVVNAISEDIEAGQQPSLNLKGYLVGNPFTGSKIDMNARVPYAHGEGIISDVLYEVKCFLSLGHYQDMDVKCLMFIFYPIIGQTVMSQERLPHQEGNSPNSFDIQ